MIRILAFWIIARPDYVQAAVVRIWLAVGQIAKRVDRQIRHDFERYVVTLIVQVRRHGNRRLPARTTVIAAAHEDAVVGLEAKRSRRASWGPVRIRRYSPAWIRDRRFFT